MEKRIAAYMFFLIAGTAVASLAILLLDSPQAVWDIYRHPERQMFWYLVLPGVAAALAARLVQRPFLRAVQARRRLRAYVWVVAGVLAAHAAYALLVSCAELLLGYLRWQEAGNLDGGGISLEWASLGWVLYAARNGLATGAISLIFGFVPNLLIGGAFAWHLLRQQPAAQPAAGASHAE